MISEDHSLAILLMRELGMSQQEIACDFQEKGIGMSESDVKEVLSAPRQDFRTGLTFKDLERRLTFKGKTKSVTEWAKSTGISRTTLFKRLDMGWDVEKTLTSRVRRQRNNSSVYVRMS